MMSAPNRASVLIQAFALLFCSACASDPVTHGIPNLATVSEKDHIYRSGQPDSEGFKYAHDILQVTNIVKYDEESEGTDAPARDFGMRVVYVPISTRQQMIGPVAPQLWAGLTNVVPGTLIHCVHGQNRTGTAVILYRIKHDHWPKAQAVAEANTNGWRTTFHALKDFVEDLR